MNALTQSIPAGFRFPVRGTVYVIWLDERGALPTFTTAIETDDIERWRRFDAAKLLQLAKAMQPARDVLAAEWAEQPADFATLLRKPYFPKGPGLVRDLVLVKVSGARGLDEAAWLGVRQGKFAARDERRASAKVKREADVEFDAESRHLPSRADRLWAAVRRESSAPAVPVETSQEFAVACCGISHTRASFAALEFIDADDRVEGSTVLHETKRLCPCCRKALVVTTTRLLGKVR